MAELKELTGMRTTLTAMGVPDTQEALDELAANAAASGNMANDIWDRRENCDILPPPS